MLSLSADSQHLLRTAGVPAATEGGSFDALRPPLPLSPFAYTLVGRLSSLGTLRHGAALLAAVRQVSVKTAVKKAATSRPTPADPTGRLAAVPHLSAAQLAAIKAEAENPPWLTEVVHHVAAHPEAPVRYMLLEDPLHPNSVSRFHLLVKREPAGAGVAFAAARYRYFVQDLGSLNGVFLNNERIRQGEWVPLQEGMRLRFAAQTRQAKMCIQAHHEAEAQEARRQSERAAGTPVPIHEGLAPSFALSSKDLHMELTFSHQMNDACRRRLQQLDSLGSALLAEEDMKAHAASAAARLPVPVRPSSAAASVTPTVAGSTAAASAGSSVSRSAGAAVPPVTSPDFHQNSVFLAQKAELEASKAAFYARFASRRPAPAAEQEPIEVMDLDELNAAPVPSNFDPNASPPVPLQRKRPRVAPSSASAAAASTADESSAAKRSRGSGSNSGAKPLSAYVLFSRESHPSVRAELEALHLSNGEAASVSSLFAETTREVAARWKRLSVEQKAVYAARAASLQPSASAAAAATAAGSVSSASVRANTPRSAEEEAFIAHLEAMDDEDANDGEYSPSIDVQRRQNAQRTAQPLVSSKPTEASRTAHAVIELSSDDEDVPIAARRTPASAASMSAPAAASSAAPPAATAAAAAAAAAPTPSPSPPVAPSPSPPTVTQGPPRGVDPALASLMEEYTCGICAEIIYQAVVLDCSHSYCRSCINEWFKKKKLCPVCRTKHKGAPTSVRLSDVTIAVLVQQNLSEEAKAERQARIERIDAAQREAELKKNEKDQLKVLMQKANAEQQGAARVQ